MFISLIQSLGAGRNFTGDLPSFHPEDTEAQKWGRGNLPKVIQRSKDKSPGLCCFLKPRFLPLVVMPQQQ